MFIYASFSKRVPGCVKIGWTGRLRSIDNLLCYFETADLEDGLQRVEKKFGALHLTCGYYRVRRTVVRQFFCTQQAKWLSRHTPTGRNKSVQVGLCTIYK